MISTNTSSAIVLVLAIRTYCCAGTRAPVASRTASASPAGPTTASLCETAAVSAAPVKRAVRSSIVLSAEIKLASLRRGRLRVRLETDPRVLDQSHPIRFENRPGSDHVLGVAPFDHAPVLE